MSLRSRSPSLPTPSGGIGNQRESLLARPRDVSDYQKTSDKAGWNRAGFVSMGGVRYGVRLAAAKYSQGGEEGGGGGGGPGRALACCGQSRAACCRAASPPAAAAALERLRLRGQRAERLRGLTERLLRRTPPLPPPRQRRAAAAAVPFRSASFSHGDGLERPDRDLDDCASLDSAVGSIEALPLAAHKHAARSLTHPLPARSASVDSDLAHRKSLQCFPDGAELGQLREESDASLADSARARSDPASPATDEDRRGPFEFPIPVREIEAFPGERASASPDGGPRFADARDESPEPTPAAVVPVPVYECTVREWPSVPAERRPSDGDDSARTPDADDAADEDRLGDLSPSARPSPPPSEEKRRALDKSKRRKGIYITKWPIQDEISGLILPESVVDGRLDGPETPDGGAASQDEAPEPRAAPRWPRISTELYRDSRPPLTSQSSEEREEFAGARLGGRRGGALARTDSLSEGESESGGPSTPRRDRTASPSPFAAADFSDGEGRGATRGEDGPRRYSKRPLRGPYGQMLEAEMKKPEVGKPSRHDEELKFLDELVASPPASPAGAPRSRGAGNLSLDDAQLKSSFGLSGSPTPRAARRASPKRKASAAIPRSAPAAPTAPPPSLHQRTASSPSKLEAFSSRAGDDAAKRKPEPSVELLAELLRGSSERSSTAAAFDGPPFALRRFNDTRTHVVVELYDTERSYVEALQILVLKYLHPLKSPENVGLVDAALVDEIFFQVPAILALHEVFLDELKKRLEAWDSKQKVGDVFLNVFTKPSVMEIYTAFINNWKKAKETIKATSASRPAFARFLQAMAREHKGKLSLDNLLIKPVQKFPRYELLIQRLIKHTEPTHPDHQLLIDAQKEIHELLVKINCTERESLELEQQQQTLKELEALVEGLANLVSAERSFLRHDTVSIPSTQGATKERALFLFSDLLLITSIKRRTGTIRKPSAVSCPGSLASTLDANKYKLLMRISLDDLEILKAKDENLRRIMREMETLTEDVNILTQIAELAGNLHSGRAPLEDLVQEMISALARQLTERQGSDVQLSCMDLSLNTPNGIENLSFIFSKPEKRTSWEEIFNEAKQKIALSDDKRPAPEFVSSVPIRKTRAGLQFTCAAPTLAIGPNCYRDVWVCNSDGYVGQVCVLTLQPEPQVTSCNGVCNARILCVACIPPPPQVKMTGSELSLSGINRQNFSNGKTGISISVQDADDGNQNIRLESSSSSEEDDDGSSGEHINENQQGTNNCSRSNVNSQNVANNQGNQVSVIKLAGSSTNNSPNISINPVMKSSSNPNVDKTAMGITTGTASPKQSIDETNNSNQPTMWLGTEDGCIHVYNCSDNIRIKKNKVKIQHGSGVHCIVYIDNKIFVSLANGDIVVYVRENGSWLESLSLSVGTVSCPVTKLLLSGGKLWCAQHTNIKIINPTTTQIEETFLVSCDSSKPISHMAISGLAIWVALHNTATLKCYHANTKEMLAEINIAPAVTKMLAGCDDIIRQHKAACLRVTSLMACRELLWIGTSAGVLLTAPASPPRPPAPPTLCGIPQGHTGHVRFLTVVEASAVGGLASLSVTNPNSSNQKQSVLRRSIHSPSKAKNSAEPVNTCQLLVISGGDGYEDFRSSGVSEIAGREDSTNHLLLWKV